MNTVCYIHGLNQSHRSFNYLVAGLPEHRPVLISYESHQPIRDSIQQVRQQLPKSGEFCLVGHSLGGILSVLMAAENADRVKHLACVSSPFGGSKAASTLRWFPGHPKIIEDLTPTSGKIELISQLRLKVPTLSVISTSGGLPVSNEPNDGIVTIASQKALPFGKKVEVKANHFEVLLHEKTVQLVRTHLFGEAA